MGKFEQRGVSGPNGRDPVLLDVTRLVATRWAGRHATGIDRVCAAYLRHYANSARAVVQHRGCVLTLDERPSRRLFDLLKEDKQGPRRRTDLVRRLAAAVRTRSPIPAGAVYLNVGHTDFDLPAHATWLQRNSLRAFYLVHDLIPVLHPQYCRPRAVSRHTGRVEGALRHASGIVVGSGAVERDLRDFAWRREIEAPPILRAPLAGAALPSMPRTWPDREYFVSVGTIETRKNHSLLLDVWEMLVSRMGDQAPMLVLAGRWGSGSEPIRRRLAASSMLRGLVQLAADCDDSGIAALMNGSRAVLMPTLAEGYGLPLVEALTLGVPVFASDLPSLREVGAGVPTFLDPRDVAAWAECVISLDAAAAARRRQIDAMHRYQPPSWDNHFSMVNDWIACLPCSSARSSWPIVAQPGADTASIRPLAA